MIETSQPAPLEESRFNPMGSMPAISAVAFLAMLGGLIAAFVFYRLELLKDPVDVVGVPLLTGYSESNEQWSFYTFVLTTLLVSLGLRHAAVRMPAHGMLPIGAVGALILLSLPAWSNSPLNLPAVTLAGVFSFMAGLRWVRLDPESAKTANLTALLGLAVWALGFPDLPVTLARHWTFPLAIVIGVAALRWIDTRFFIASRRSSAAWLHLAAAILVLGTTVTANPREFILGLAGAAGFVLGSRAGPHTGVLNALSGFPWWAFVGILSGVLYLGNGWPSLGFVQPLAALAGGAGAAAVLYTAFRSRNLARFCSVISSGSLERWVPWLSVAAIGSVTVAKPWWGFVSAVIAVVVFRVSPRGRVRVVLAFAAALLLHMGILPAGSPGGIDGFHDGQILSGVWEFETGRSLYAEVFPLRSFEFFVAWISRGILAKNTDSYFLGMGLVAALPVGGAYLLTFAWTRSLVWSFATALVIAVYPELSGRMGVPLWLAAVGVLVLRSHNPLCMGWLAVCGWVGALLGYDVFVSFVVACVAAVFLAGPPGLKQPLKRLMGARIGWSSALLAAVVVPFTLFVAIWQGPRAAMAYWWLLVDNVRTYAAFCGLPLRWDNPGLRFLLISSLVVFGFWAAVGTTLWKQMSHSRRRAWIFLLVQFVLMANRGLARSDYKHLNVVIYPSIVFASIGLFECLRYFRRQGSLSVLTDHRTVAAVAAAFACWVSPHGKSTPWDFAQYVRRTTSSLDSDEGRSAMVLQRTREDEYLWEIESAMMSYLYKRHNPTRHALSYCISSSEEQRVAVAAMREHPPKLIAWVHTSGSDGIENPIRFYVISQHLYRNYRPTELGGFLQPVEPDSEADVPELKGFLGQLHLGYLALRWGKDRIPRLGDRLVARESTAAWQDSSSDIVLSERVASDATPHATCWETVCAIDSRGFNYLKIEFACSALPGKSAGKSQAVLEFAPRGAGFEPESAISFTVVADSTTRAYLLPVGCSPGWSWRTGIERLRLCAPEYTTITQPAGECWRIDDIRD